MKKFVINIIFVLFLIITNNKLIAQNSSLVDFSKLKEIINNKTHGDVIYIKNGIYKDVNITIKNLKPVAIKAETPGRVILKGETQIRLQSCNNIVLSGFYFEETKSKQLIKLNNVKESRIENNYFKNSKGYSPYSCIIGIQSNSQSNTIERNTFEGIQTVGVLIDDGENIKNVITKNIFKNIPSVKSVYPNTNGNGMECIGLGKGLKLPVKDLYTTVSFNYFENIQADGMEIICVKSNKNEIMSNYITKSEGGISIRYGNNCTIVKNVFINNNQSLRIFGENHLVSNNHFENLNFGIQLPAADYKRGENIKKVGYYQSNNIKINDNSFSNIKKDPVLIGGQKKKGRDLLAKNIYFYENLIDNNAKKVEKTVYFDKNNYRFGKSW